MTILDEISFKEAGRAEALSRKASALCRTNRGPLRNWTHHRSVEANELAIAPTIGAAELSGTGLPAAA